MEDIKLEQWQALTIQALVGERQRVAERAQSIVNGINATLKRYTEEWADGEGPFEFEQRGDGMYLVEKDETGLAPAP